MIASTSVLRFAKICRVLMILHQLIYRGVANFGTRCIKRKWHKLSCLLQYDVNVARNELWNLLSFQSLHRVVCVRVVAKVLEVNTFLSHLLVNLQTAVLYRNTDLLATSEMLLAIKVRTKRVKSG